MAGTPAASPDPAKPVVEDTSKTTPVVSEVATTPAVVETPALPTLDEVVTKATEAVLAKVTPTLTSMSETMQALAQSHKEFVLKMTPPVDVPKPEAPATPIADPLNDVQKQIAGLLAEVETVRKSISGIIPSIPARSEETPKPVTKLASKNDVFNPLFGIK